MTACYDRSGIRFLYPENWQITDEEISRDGFSLSVQSPESAFWSLNVYEAERDPGSLVDAVLKSMEGEYEGMESSAITERFGEIESLGYDMCFYCLDFVVDSRVMAGRALGRTLLILWQAEDREFDRLEPVFRAMTLSLLNPQPVAS
jgi:hypothetical protein